MKISTVLNWVLTIATVLGMITLAWGYAYDSGKKEQTQAQLQGNVDKLDGTAADHEKRIRSLEDAAEVNRQVLTWMKQHP